MKTQQHPLADVQSPYIGPATHIWQIAVVLPEARIDSNVTVTNGALPRSKEYPSAFAMPSVSVGFRRRGGGREPGARRALPRGPR